MPPKFQNLFDRFHLHACHAIAGCKRAFRGDAVSAGQRQSASKLAVLEQRVMLSASPIAPAALEAPAPNNDSTSPTSLVFVDASVPQSFELTEEVKRLGGPDYVQVVFLDSERDGIEQIDDVISNSENIESVHIFSHGNQNGIQLGSTWLNQETLTPYASTLAGWRDSFSADADLLIYGCDLAAQESGQQLLESIAELTKADVAASDDLTGHSDLGGDWELEYQVGSISSTLEFSQSFLNQWYGLLETVTFQQGLNGYQGAADTYVRQFMPDTTHGNLTTLLSDGGIFDNQVLIKFENIFGSGPNQIPFGSTIQNVTLEFTVNNPSAAGQTITLHEMLSGWEENSTWNSLANGVSQDGNESASTPDASVDGSATTAQFVGAGITQTVQGWSDGNTNYGWVILNSDASNFWQARSSDFSNVNQRPELQIEFTPPTAAAGTTPAGFVDGIWLSTRDNVTDSNINGLSGWTDGTVLQFADPNLSLGPGTTSGTFSAPFNLDTFTDGNSEVQGIHYVSRDLTVGGNIAIDLQAGDLLIASNDSETVVGNNTINVDREDIFVFRPDTAGDYSSGSFFILFEDIEDRKIHAFTLVEQDTRIGTTDVAAGDVLLSVAGDHELVYWFRTTDVGEGTTEGTLLTLIDGKDIDLDEQIQGLELLENDVTIGGSTFAAGGLIVTANNAVTIDGLDIDDSDLVYLNFSQDSLAGSTAQATATKFFTGSDIGFDPNQEDIHSFTLASLAPATGPTIIPNSPPTAVNDSYRVDQGGTLSTLGGQWFDNAWASRQEIEINNSNSSSAIIDEPLLVVLDGANFDYSLAQSAGQDLRFVDASGTLLDFEIESWNSGGQSTVWVKAPPIDAGTSARIWMYYDNASAVDAQNSGDVWGDDYLAVYHLGNDLLDSTSNNNNPLSSSVSASSGQIGESSAFNGSTSFINLGTNASIDNIFEQGGSLSAWVNLDSYGASGFGRIFDKADGVVASDSGWSLSIDSPDGRLIFEHGFDGQFGRWRAPAGAISLSSWHQITLTYAGTPNDDPRLFVDGVEITLTETRTPSGNSISDAGLDLAIGNHLPDANRGFDGLIDEVRIVDRVLTQDEIVVQFQNASAGFTNLSPTETRTAPTGVLVGDFDPDGDLLAVTQSTGPAHGSLTLNADGSFVYIHDGSENFTDSFTYEIKDNNGGIDSATVNITINDVNSPPTVSLVNETNSLAENTSTSSNIKLADIVVDDDTAGTNELSIAGADAASFEIIGTELFLRSGVPIDFETKSTYSILINVDDTSLAGTPEGQTTFTLNITNVNEAPTVELNNSVPSISEDTDTSSEIRIADIVITDDGSGTNSLSLSGNDAAQFLIVDNELRLRSGTNLNADTQSQYDVTVNVSDASLGGITDSVSFTLTIADVNSSPTVSLANQITSLPEDTDTRTGIRLADILISDDASGSNTLSLSGSDAAEFKIIGDQLWLRANTLLDFETRPAMDVTVSVSDAAINATDSVTYNLTVDDVNESPTANAALLIMTEEDADEAEFDLSDWFTDQDAVDATLSYSVQNPPADWVEHRIAGANTLKLRPTTNTNGNTQIVVRATDSSGNFVDSLVMITVAPVNDTISLSDQQLLTEFETSVQGRVADTTVDVDGETLDFVVVAQPQNGQLEVSPDGAFRFTPDAGFSGRDRFQVVAQDGVTASNPATIDLVVADTIAPPPTPAPVPLPADPTTTESTEPEEERLPEVAAPSQSESDDDNLDFVPPLQRPGLGPSFGDEDPAASSDEPSINFSEETTQSTKIISFAKLSTASSNPNPNISLVSSAAPSSTATTATQLTALSQPGPMWQQLDNFQEAIATDASIQKFTIGSVGTASSGLVVGYVIWALRSGVLMSSLMAAMPAWNLLDPLAIVSVAEKGNGDGESLEDIVETQKQKLDESTSL